MKQIAPCYWCFGAMAVLGCAAFVGMALIVGWAVDVVGGYLP